MRYCGSKIKAVAYLYSLFTLFSSFIAWSYILYLQYLKNILWWICLVVKCLLFYKYGTYVSSARYYLFIAIFTRNKVNTFKIKLIVSTVKQLTFSKHFGVDYSWDSIWLLEIWCTHEEMRVFNKTNLRWPTRYFLRWPTRYFLIWPTCYFVRTLTSLRTLTFAIFM